MAALWHCWFTHSIFSQRKDSFFMTYQISIALIHDNQIEDTLNATCSRTYDARVLIESLCNGWQMSSKRIVLINGKLLAIGHPRAIREQLSQHPMSDFDLDAQTDQCDLSFHNLHRSARQ